jgi:hypothetical protein
MISPSTRGRRYCQKSKCKLSRHNCITIHCKAFQAYFLAGPLALWPNHSQTSTPRTGHCRLHQHLRKMGLQQLSVDVGSASRRLSVPAYLPQHVRLAAILAGAHCTALKTKLWGNSGGPEKNYQLCREPRSEGLNDHGRTQKKKKNSQNRRKGVNLSRKC